MDILYDEFYGSDVTALFEKAENNVKDECAYLLAADMMGVFGAGASYVSSEGVLGSGIGPVGEDAFKEYVGIVESKTEELGLKIYEGLAAKVNGYEVRVHGGGFGDYESNVNEFFEKLGTDGVEGAIHYLKEDTIFFGEALVAGIKVDDNMYFINGLGDTGNTIFEDAAEENGFTLVKGLTGEMEEVMAAFQDEDQE